MKIIDMFNEDNTVEQMLIEAATQSGWQYVKSQDIPRSSDSVLVESWLLEALIRLNPITHQQAEQVIYKLRAAITCGGNYDELVTANDRFRTLLFNVMKTQSLLERMVNIYLSDSLAKMRSKIIVS